MDTLRVEIGPYEVGEIPEPLDLTIKSGDDVAINLGSATNLEFRYVIGNEAEQTAIVQNQDPPNGMVRIVWDNTSFVTAGILQGRLLYSIAGLRPVGARVVGRILEPPVLID